MRNCCIGLIAIARARRTGHCMFSTAHSLGTCAQDVGLARMEDGCGGTLSRCVEGAFRDTPHHLEKKKRERSKDQGRFRSNAAGASHFTIREFLIAPGHAHIATQFIFLFLQTGRLFTFCSVLRIPSPMRRVPAGRSANAVFGCSALDLQPQLLVLYRNNVCQHLRLQLP